MTIMDSQISTASKKAKMFNAITLEYFRFWVKTFYIFSIKFWGKFKHYKYIEGKLPGRTKPYLEEYKILAAQGVIVASALLFMYNIRKFPSFLTLSMYRHLVKTQMPFEVDPWNLEVMF